MSRQLPMYYFICLHTPLLVFHNISIYSHNYLQLLKSNNVVVYYCRYTSLNAQFILIETSFQHCCQCHALLLILILVYSRNSSSHRYSNSFSKREATLQSSYPTLANNQLCAQRKLLCVLQLLHQGKSRHYFILHTTKANIKQVHYKIRYNQQSIFIEIFPNINTYMNTINCIYFTGVRKITVSMSVSISIWTPSIKRSTVTWYKAKEQ